MDEEGLYELGIAREPGRALGGNRAVKLCDAIEANPDFKLVETRLGLLDGKSADVFIVICVCDSVPSKNHVGIEYEEPLAIMVSSDQAALPQVRPLRRSFPLTSHQNSVPLGEPTSLCLYDQAPAAVLRTWTAPAFLRKIQWWLTETAEGRLHRLDQPLEPLFFEPPVTLVLPAGYLKSPEHINQELVISSIIRRGDSDQTPSEQPIRMLIMERSGNSASAHAEIHLVAMALRPILHGPIEREPNLLGDLEDQLQARGAGVIDELREHLKTYVGGGRARHEQCSATVLLLYAQLKRSESGPIEKVQGRAFWIDKNPLDIGAATGTLIHQPPDLRYYVDQLWTANNSTEWRNLSLIPLNVQSIPDDEAARLMSGTSNAGPRAVLAGAGALGSSMLDLWRRAGWGQWGVIDPDFVEPHNLIRHTCSDLGRSKATAVALRDMKLWQLREPKIQPITGDAGNMNDPAVRAALQQADLIVDATTTLEVPRTLANESLHGRIVSAFVTPDGSAAVLLAEDDLRKLRIDSVEAQYWRAVVAEEWGATHLPRTIRSFVSGPSCRDISAVMAFSSVQAFACTLAENIQSLPPPAAIRVWSRQRGTGSVTALSVQTEESIIQDVATLTLVWDHGTLNKVRKLRTAALPAETGGVLIGYHDFNQNRVYVVDVLAAPPDSIGTATSFERGVKGLAQQVRQAQERTAGHIRYLGEWHSHPEGHSSRPSRQDVEQILFLGDLASVDHLPALMLIVAKNENHWLMAV